MALRRLWKENSSPRGHIAGKLVERSLALFADRGANHRVVWQGPWTVVSYDDGTANLVHYKTPVLTFDLRTRRIIFVITADQLQAIDKRFGFTSDQTGINSALIALGSSQRFTQAYRPRRYRDR
jgi:hypothetical protein